MGTGEDNLARQAAAPATESGPRPADWSEIPRLALLERLVSDVGHDVKNMLTVIIWNLDLVNHVAESEKVKQRAETALSGALNGVDLVRQLMSFARLRPGEASALYLPPPLRRVMKLAHAGITSDVTVHMRFEDDLWLVTVDPGSFECSILDLMFSFADAAPDGTKLTIEFANKSLPDGEHVVISAGEGGCDEWKRVISQLASRVGGQLLTEGEAVALALPRAAQQAEGE